ncbi:MAG TPA: diaminopimelate epimerase [Acidimicrobiales bacterium]|nr:diaminopimelate epimerase [Acidimicrobiales bacterium]
MSRARGMRLRKHHGLGNDFLILIDLEDAHPLDAELARGLCDRHTGAGADGIIRVTTGAGGLVMELRNADGGPAETSGNGLRCLGQALVQAGVVRGPEVVVETVVGRRRLEVGPTGPDGVAEVSVAMGPLRIGPAVPQEDPQRRAVEIDLGNPHLVVLVPDPAAVDLAAEGSAIESRYAEGINVEFAAASGPDLIQLRTWERGAGETLACGSGSCAAAAALHQWGLVGARPVVRNPGGDVTVTLGDEPVLSGPSQFVCTVEMA